MCYNHLFALKMCIFTIYYEKSLKTCHKIRFIFLKYDLKYKLVRSNHGSKGS